MLAWIENFNSDQTKQIHQLMIQEWWCADRQLDDVVATINGSDITLAAVNDEQRIVAFARAITDGVFKGVLFDVIVHKKCRALLS